MLFNLVKAIHKLGNTLKVGGKEIVIVLQIGIEREGVDTY